jgi:hypothetical protein
MKGENTMAYQNQAYQNQYQNQAYQNQAYQNQSDGALDWDSDITESSSFTLLPDGDYSFRITKLERGRYEGGERLSACPKAIITLSVSDGAGHDTVITENLLLHKKLEGKLSQFFESLGMKGKDETLKMNWDIIGRGGVAKVIVHEYNGRDGNQHQVNRISKFYPSYDLPQAAPQSAPQAAPAYQPAYNGYRR